eukprot:6002787-Lingulodinium_polyedra.AAC.1
MKLCLRYSLKSSTRAKHRLVAATLREPTARPRPRCRRAPPTGQRVRRLRLAPSTPAFSSLQLPPPNTACNAPVWR